MDNLTNKTIKQYQFMTEYGIIVITCVCHDNNFVEFWGHLVGYGIMHHFIGYDVPKGGELRKYAKDVMEDFFDVIRDEQEEEIAEYMGEAYGKDEKMQDEIKKLYKKFSENMARVVKEGTK